MTNEWPSRAISFSDEDPTGSLAWSRLHRRNRHPSVKRHDYCLGSETETTMLRDCPPDAKATLALIALSAICILGWLADLSL